MSSKGKKMPDRVTILSIILFILLLEIPKKFLPKRKDIIVILCILEIVTYFIHIQFFNEKEKFDNDSKYICSLIFIPPVVLFYVLIVGKGIAGAEEIIGNYAIFAVMAVLSFLFYFWLIYLLRCKMVINEIKKNWHVFLVKMIKPILKAVLVCFSTALIIDSLLGPCDNMKLFYQIINIIINSSYPFIDMYIYVRSEIDEFDKREKEKQEKREELEKENYKYDFYNYE